MNGLIFKKGRTEYPGSSLDTPGRVTACMMISNYTTRTVIRVSSFRIECPVLNP